MNRPTTTKKESDVLREFQKILRSGRDLSANSMYEEAGSKHYLAYRTAGNIIRKHYRKQITEEMRIFVSENSDLEFICLLKKFSEKFHFCKRESRLLIGYIR